jgi:chorismate-pyruvate lyase
MVRASTLATPSRLATVDAQDTTNEPTGRWIDKRKTRRTNPTAVQTGSDHPDDQAWQVYDARQPFSTSTRLENRERNGAKAA